MKFQQVDTPKGKVWEVNGYLINGSQKVRVKKRGFDSKQSARHGLIIKVFCLTMAKVNTIKKQPQT